MEEKGGAKTEQKNDFIFRDPKEYEHLPMKERKALTKKMLGQHKGWVKGLSRGKSQLKIQ